MSSGPDRMLIARVNCMYTEWHDGTGLAGHQVDGPFNAAFYLTPMVDPHERSYVDRQDTSKVPLTHYHSTARTRDLRARPIGRGRQGAPARMREGWRIGYTSGTGVNGMAASAVHSGDWRGFEKRTYGASLGPLSSGADVERKALAVGASYETTDMLFLLTDLQKALQTAISLSSGKVGHGGSAEKALQKRRDQDNAIAWICSHFGTPGNEKRTGGRIRNRT